MQRESGRLRLAEFIGLAEELNRYQNRFRNDCRQVLRDTLEEAEEHAQPGSSGAELDTNQSRDIGSLRHQLETDWHEADSSIEELFSQVCDTIYKFVTTAEARIGEHERRVRRQSEAAKLALSRPRTTNDDDQ